jgi:nucleotide-binding universal stress UspA family protein
VIRAIVVGTDGSPTANDAFKQASDLAMSLGAKLHVVSAYEPASGARVEGAADQPESSAWLVGPDVEVGTVLTDAVGAAKAKGIECEAHARKGDPAEAILEVADEHDADLIVVGSKGMRGAKRFLLGSVPDKISHHAPCSVLIIRTT